MSKTCDNKYKLCDFKGSNIDIDKVNQNIKNNKTFEVFMNICCQYDICIFKKDSANSGWCVKENKNLIEECTRIKQSKYQEAIAKLETLQQMDMEWLDSKMRIDKVTEDLKRNIKNLDMLISLLRNVYTSKSLINITKKCEEKKKYMLIEEFSN
jgi:hypothetical protein